MDIDIDCLEFLVLDLSSRFGQCAGFALLLLFAAGVGFQA